MPYLILESTFVKFDSPDLLLFTTLTYHSGGPGIRAIEPLALWLLRHWAPDLGLSRVLWWTLGRCWAGAEAASLVWDCIHWGQGVCGEEGLGIMVQRQNFWRPCTRAVGPPASSTRIQMKAHPESRRQAEEQIDSPLPRPFPEPFPWQLPHPGPVGEHQNLPHICILCYSVQRLLPEELHLTLAKAPWSQQTRYSHPPCSSSCQVKPPRG